IISQLRQFQPTLQRALDLLFPPQCTVCKRSGTILCSTCFTGIRPLLPPRCYRCSYPLSPNGHCQSCYAHPLRLDGLRAASQYQEPLRSCIHAFKYDGKIRLAEALGSLLIQTYMAHKMLADMIIPIPLHSQRQQARGYNQASLLAKVCATQLGIPFNDTIVTRVRPTSTQALLKPVERQQNVAGAFLCTSTLATEMLPGRRILIVDDVCTTGATLEACAAPLFAAGALSVWGLVLARPH